MPHTPDPDTNLVSAIHALLLSRAGGQAVADALLDNTHEWQRRSLVADLRARRAWDHYNALLGADAAHRHDGSAAHESPWSRADPVEPAEKSKTKA